MEEGKTYYTHTHMSIEGCLRHHINRKILFFEDDKANPLSDKEARAYLAECQAKGWKVLPLCKTSECPDFDHFGGGCPKHEQK